MALFGHLYRVSAIVTCLPFISLCCVHTFRVLYYARRLALHHGDSRVGGTQIDTDDGALDLAGIGICVLCIASSELC